MSIASCLRPSLALSTFLLIVAGTVPGHAAKLIFEKNCTSGQASAAEAAFKAVMPIVKNADSALAKMSAKDVSALYKTWFGQPSDARLGTVKQTIGDLSTLLHTTQKLTVECQPPRCTGGEFARTAYQNDYIALCKGFFEAPLRGEDSQVGTLLHELTHLVANTNDYTYGREDARKRADGNPNDAVVNADSYEYFMEDLSKK